MKLLHSTPMPEADHFMSSSWIDGEQQDNGSEEIADFRNNITAGADLQRGKWGEFHPSKMSTEMNLPYDFLP